MLNRHKEALEAIDRSLALEVAAHRWRNRAIKLDWLGRKKAAAEAERRAKALGG
jgi:hypothetical protein